MVGVTYREFVDSKGWSLNHAAHEAKVSWSTVKRAYMGEAVRDVDCAEKIADSTGGVVSAASIVFPERDAA